MSINHELGTRVSVYTFQQLLEVLLAHCFLVQRLQVLQVQVETLMLQDTGDYVMIFCEVFAEVEVKLLLIIQALSPQLDGGQVREVLLLQLTCEHCNLLQEILVVPLELAEFHFEPL